ncbi:MAG: ParB/RepB/Spo0J family partition protein [Deltaproteobacteria bacterium]|nr:ParB/RepB/Spo0J family partition protein [Deltaproteobacteria bacterium]
MPIEAQTTFLDLDLTLIAEDPENVRSALTGIGELAEAIRQDGVLQPILVQEHKTEAGRFQVIAGHRRLAAAKQVGLKTIPAVVRAVSDDDKRAMQLIENVQREDLSAIEVARSLQAIFEKVGGTRESIALVAGRVGRTTAWVQNHLRLMKLSPKVLDAVERSRLSFSQAREIVALEAKGDIAGAIAAAAAFKRGTLTRAELRKKVVQPTGDSSAQDSEKQSGGVETAEQRFEALHDGFSVRIVVSPGVVIDSSLRSRIDAALASVGRIIGAAA